MRQRTSRRFGAHEVQNGKWKGGLHVAAKAYTIFRGELSYLANYLDRRLLPREPEEVEVTAIILNQTATEIGNHVDGWLNVCQMPEKLSE